MNWLLLRGLARESRHWGEFPAILESRLGDPGRVFCLDLPGAGTECRRASPASVAGIARDVRSRWLSLRDRHPGRPWGLIAVSLGGMVGMQWCRDFPGDFSRLVLLNSSAGNLTSPLERMNWRNVPRLFKAVFGSDLVARERSILELTTCLQRDLAQVAAKWGELARENPVSRTTFFRQLWAASRFRAPEKLALPVLVLGSRADRFTSIRCSEALARHFAAETAYHPGAGHDLALDDPEWVSAQVISWIRRDASASRAMESSRPGSGLSHPEPAHP